MMIHIYQGFCPDELQPDSRDPDCPACQVEAERNKLRAENARMKEDLHQLTVALESVLAGKPVRNIDEMILAAKESVG